MRTISTILPTLGVIVKQYCSNPLQKRLTAPATPAPPLTALGAGIKVLEAIDITDKDALFASNMLAFVTVHQHAGLAFLMLKRYKDAARILNEVGWGERG